MLNRFVWDKVRFTSGPVAATAMALAVFACDSQLQGPKGPAMLPTPPNGGSGGDGGGASGNASLGGMDPGPIFQPPAGCGDGTKAESEDCDDGNNVRGDGCSAVCKIEDGFDCDSNGTNCAAIACGDGRRSASEACDDMNTTAGDGCAADCLSVEEGYTCFEEGVACNPRVLCGDSVTTSPELCDDGNLMPGDGCSESCKIERGYKCTGNPSVCSATTCGDGMQEGAEGCDDGNLFPFDGCSPSCQPDPVCAPGMACGSNCGDGLVIAEECDDGNILDGDGCSATCALEDGWMCNNDAEPVTTLSIPVVYRDFKAHTDVGGHPSFDWDGYAQGVAPGYSAGLVNVQLDAEGKPSYAAWDMTGPDPKLDSQEQFSSWYRDSALGIPFADTLELVDPGTGTFTFDDQQWFPLDDRGWATTAPVEQPRGCAFINEAAMCAMPPCWEACGTENYFFFTSEVHYWFTYSAAANATLDFRGDDDVWVFVKGRLVVDIGGIHAPVAGSITLNADAVDVEGTPLGLVEGETYEIAIFQAERNEGASSYRLQLTGFNTTPTTCVSRCGDGVVTLGEECDDGSNLGGYGGKCGPGCIVDSYCGDGVLDREFEACDDGNQANGDDCSALCRTIQ